MAIDHDIRHFVILEQRLERSEAKHIVSDGLNQTAAVGTRQQHLVFDDELVDNRADLIEQSVVASFFKLGYIDPFDQAILYAGPQPRWYSNCPVAPTVPRRAGDLQARTK